VDIARTFNLVARDHFKAVALISTGPSGRPAEQRARLAEALVAACAEALALSPTALLVEFTQHAGDETFWPGRGLAPDWTPAEAQTFAAGPKDSCS
jgi:hypothetical protein